jgi:Cdc6-like AAA superfamily ATPase
MMRFIFPTLKFLGALLKKIITPFKATSSNTAAPSEDPNSHLKNYIEYYQNLEAPRFAVLVTGEWGTGKTHLLKELLPWEGENAKACYISLFGMKNSEEVFAAVYAGMHPVSDKIARKI